MNPNPYTDIFLYAFWRYDGRRFLGAPVSQMDLEGRVRTSSDSGYGKSWFCPVKLLPREVGEELNQKLREIDAKLEEDIRLLREQAYEERKKLLGIP